MRLIITSLLLAMLAGCNADRPATSNDAGTEPAPASAPTPSPPPAQGDGVTMRYACADGNSIEIVGGDTARVTLSDGRTVALARVEGSSPPLYSDDTLEFAVGSEGGVLAGDDGASRDCTAE